MTDRPSASSALVRARMQQQRRRDTQVEMELRRELWRRGLRYRIDRSVVVPRRRHDIVFGPARVVVDVRGCFWHACPTHGTTPKANREWWEQKLSANRRRDLHTEEALRGAGWEVIVIWEHDDIELSADRIERTVRSRRSEGGGRAVP